MSKGQQTSGGDIIFASEPFRMLAFLSFKWSFNDTFARVSCAIVSTGWAAHFWPQPNTKCNHIKTRIQFITANEVVRHSSKTPQYESWTKNMMRCPAETSKHDKYTNDCGLGFSAIIWPFAHCGRWRDLVRTQHIKNNIIITKWPTRKFIIYLYISFLAGAESTFAYYRRLAIIRASIRWKARTHTRSQRNLLFWPAATLNSATF